VRNEDVKVFRLSDASSAQREMNVRSAARYNTFILKTEYFHSLNAHATLLFIFLKKRLSLDIHIK